MPQSSPVLHYFLLCSGGNFSNCLFGLEVLTRGVSSVKLVHQMPPNPSPLSVHCFLSFRSYQFIHFKKILGLCLMSLNLYRFLYVHVLIETNVFVQTSPLMVQFSIICWGLGVVWPKLSHQILMTFVASLTITDDISETNDSKKVSLLW